MSSVKYSDLELQRGSTPNPCQVPLHFTLLISVSLEIKSEAPEGDTALGFKCTKNVLKN